MRDALISDLAYARAGLWFCTLVAIVVRICVCSPTLRPMVSFYSKQSTDQQPSFLEIQFTTFSSIPYVMSQGRFGREQVLYHPGTIRLVVSDIFGCGNHSRSMAKGSVSLQTWSFSVIPQLMEPYMA